MFTVTVWQISARLIKIVYNKEMTMLEKILNFIRSISIELTVLFYAIGCGILNGAAIETNLTIWKICRIEFNYSETICTNITYYESENKVVQKRCVIYHFIIHMIIK